MGCGCGKKKNQTLPPVAGRVANPSVGSVVMYDVFDSEGGFVASFSNPVLARTEARRTSGKTIPRRSSDPAPESLITTTQPAAMVAAEQER